VALQGSPEGLLRSASPEGLLRSASPEGLLRSVTSSATSQQHSFSNPPAPDPLDQLDYSAFTLSPTDQDAEASLDYSFLNNEDEESDSSSEEADQEDKTKKRKRKEQEKGNSVKRSRQATQPALESSSASSAASSLSVSQRKPVKAIRKRLKKTKTHKLSRFHMEQDLQICGTPFRLQVMQMTSEGPQWKWVIFKTWSWIKQYHSFQAFELKENVPEPTLFDYEGRLIRFEWDSDRCLYIPCRGRTVFAPDIPLTQEQQQQQEAPLFLAVNALHVGHTIYQQ